MYRKSLLALALALALRSGHACDLNAPATAPGDAEQLVDAVARLALASDCQILIDDSLATSEPVRLASTGTVDDALTLLALEREINWQQDERGVVQLTPSSPVQSTQAIEVSAVVSAPAEGRATEPAQRTAVSAAAALAPAAVSTLDGERIEQDVLKDLSASLARIPGVYPMGNFDSVRGIANPSAADGSSTQLVSVNDIPLPDGAFSLAPTSIEGMSSIELSREANGLAASYGSIGGELAMRGPVPSAVFGARSMVTSGTDVGESVRVELSGGLGVPGLRSTILARKLVSADGRQADARFLDDRMLLAGLAWSSPESRHELRLDALQLAGTGANLASPQLEVDRGRHRDVEGMAANWAWHLDDAMTLHALAASTEADIAGVTISTSDPAPTTDTAHRLLLRNAQLRLDWQPVEDWTIAIGHEQSLRGLHMFSVSDLEILEDEEFWVDDEVQLLPTQPGQPASISWRTRNALETSLKQSFLDFAWLNGPWGAGGSLRQIDVRTPTTTRVRNLQVSNCTTNQPGLDCAEALGITLGEEGNARDGERLGGQLWLRRELPRNQWLSLTASNSITAPWSVTGDLPAPAAFSLRNLAIGYGIANDAHDARVSLFTGRLPDAVVRGQALQEGTLRVAGAEFEYAYRPTQAIELWANATLLETEAGFAGIHYDAAGAPRWMASIGGAYAFDSGWFASANASLADAAWARRGFSQSAPIRLPSRELLDLRVGYRTDHWSASLWGSNLLDDEIILSATGTTNLSWLQMGSGRQVGVDVEWRY